MTFAAHAAPGASSSSDWVFRAAALEDAEQWRAALTLAGWNVAEEEKIDEWVTVEKAEVASEIGGGAAVAAKASAPAPAAKAKAKAKTPAAKAAKAAKAGSGASEVQLVTGLPAGNALWSMGGIAAEGVEVASRRVAEGGVRGATRRSASPAPEGAKAAAKGNAYLV